MKDAAIAIELNLSVDNFTLTRSCDFNSEMSEFIWESFTPVKPIESNDLGTEDHMAFSSIEE
jgi:hypothetical protein